MPITREELELARVRIRQWPFEERRSIARMTEPEVRTIALLTALLDIRPEDSDTQETEENPQTGTSEGET